MAGTIQIGDLVETNSHFIGHVTLITTETITVKWIGWWRYPVVGPRELRPCEGYAPIDYAYRDVTKVEHPELLEFVATFG